MKGEEKGDRSVVRRWVVALLLVAAAAGGMAREARACSGGSAESLLYGERHPDQPLAGFIEGRLGVLRASYARTYLLVAYRYLAGMPLDDQEQRAALQVICERQSALVCARTASTAKATAKPISADAPSETFAIDRWRAARRAALGRTPPPIRRTTQAR